MHAIAMTTLNAIWSFYCLKRRTR